MNGPQKGDELPIKNKTKKSFVGEAEQRLNQKCSNSSESRRIVQKRSFITLSENSDYAQE